MVERAERLGVAIRTAQRLYDGGTDAELRTALVLLDSAAELLLYAGVRVTTQWWPMRERMYQHTTEPVEVLSLPSPVKMADLPKKARWRMSKRAMQRVEKEFGKKLELLEFAGEIPTSYRIALSRLHEYRNAAYHRDSLREETLRTSVELHFYLTAQLLVLLKPEMYRLPHRHEVERLVTLLDVTDEVVRGGQPALQNAISKMILDRLRLDERDVQEVLADNIVSRVETVEDELDFILEALPEMNVRRPDAIRLMQEDEPLITMEELRSRKYPITQSTIDGWRVDAEKVRGTKVAIDAFNIYGEVEERMSTFERETEKMAIAADESVQHQIDVARGK